MLVYTIEKKKGGLGLRSVEHEAELGFIRRGVYLSEHEEIKDARARYQAMRRAGWRNPITDMEHMLEKYRINAVAESGKGLIENIKRTVREATKSYQNQLMQEWTINMNYGRVVMKEQKIIKFPAYESPLMDGWRRSLLQAEGRRTASWIRSSTNKKNVQKGMQEAGNSIPCCNGMPGQ